MDNFHTASGMRRVTLRGAVVIAAALLLAGCTSSNTNGSASPAPTSTASTKPSAPQSIPPAAIPGKDGVVGASADLVGAICEYSGGAWNLTGTLKNSQKSPQNYTVRISVSDKKTSSVVDAVVITQKLDPGKSAKLDKTAIIHSPNSVGLNCLINVTRKSA